MTARAGTVSSDPLGCQFELRHFGLWRLAVCGVAASALAALAAWLAAGSAPRTPIVWVAAAGGGVLLLAWALSLARAEAGTLSRHAGSWCFQRQGAFGAAPESGELRVAIDLGSFMLLVLRRGRHAGQRWLPAQRLGHETGWHGLRCAVHAPRPAPPGAPASPR